MCNWHEGKVLDVNKPSAWFCTVIVNGKTDVIGLFALWEQIDQKKGYYKATKAKYNWEAMKAEYMASDFIDVAPFLQSKYSLNTVQSWDAREKTKWWADEKKQIQAQIKIEAIKQFKSNIRGQWDAVMEKLEMAHVHGLENLANMILDQGKVVQRKRITDVRDPETQALIGSEIIDVDWLMPYLNHWDVTSIIKHIKLEKWEPTDILDTNGKSLARSWLDEVKKNKSWKDKDTPSDGA